ERQLNGVYPDNRSFSIQQDEFDAQMREINQLERRLEAESWQLDRQRRRQELELRVGFEDTMRARQDVIEDLRQQLHELYRTGERALDELYRKQSELYSGYWDPFQESEEAVSLREELAGIEWKIANSQAGFDDLTSALAQEITTLEWEVQQLYQTLDELEWERNATLDQLEELYRQIEAGFNGGAVYGSLEQQLTEVRARMSELDLNDAEVLALAAELMELEARLAGGTETIELQLAAAKQEISSLEAEVSRIYTVVDEQEILLASKKETLETLYHQLDELRLSVPAAVDGTAVQVASVSVETQIAALEAEIAALEVEIATIAGELDENRTVEQSMMVRLDVLYQEVAHLTDSTMDEESLYRWIDEIRVRVNNLLIQHDLQALHDELAGIESQIAEIEAVFQGQIASVEHEIAVLEEEIVLLQPVADVLETALHVAEAELGSIHHQLEELNQIGPGLGETHARIEEIEALLAASYPDSDIWAPLHEELSFLEALSIEVEAAFQAEVSALEGPISVLEAEVVGLQQEFEFQTVEIDALHDRIDGLHHELNGVYNADGELEHLYSRRDQIYVELDSTSVVIPVTSTFISEEPEHKIAALEEEMQRISNAIQKYESALHSSQARLEELYGKIDGAYRTGSDVEHLYLRMEEINVRLAELSDATLTGGSYERALAAIDDEIVRTDARFREQTRALEDRITDMEMGLYRSQRDMEDRMSDLNREMEWGMLDLDDERFQLQERRWALEERMWGRMDGVRTDMDMERWAIEDELARVYSEQLQPIEDQMRAIEMQLRELQQRERSLNRELQVVENQFAPMEREMEDIAFSIFENVVSQFAELDGADVGVETVPATTE
ncbi:MAG: hypothetical protein IIB33_04820, partial [Chloroflexi bacterium]|nr:hypothetical protein [Chloroflexota bacterium]